MSRNRALLLAAVALATACFAWALVGSPAAPIPVIVGALASVIAGLLADRLGGRLVLTGILGATALVLLVLGVTGIGGPLLGVAAGAVPAGVPFLARWFRPEQTGLVLGLYCLGTLGIGVAFLAGPTFTAALAPTLLWLGAALLALMVAALFYLGAGEVPWARNPGQSKPELLLQPITLLLTLWYMIAFGSYLAFGLYLPTLHREVYGVEANGLPGLFLLLGVLARPVGGWLADRLDGRRALTVSLLGVGGLATLLTLHLTEGPFKAVLCLLAIAFGLGSGAVFQQIPVYFAGQTGLAAGLISGVGFLGALVPTFLMAPLRDRLGSYTPAFALLAAVAFASCFLLPLIGQRRVPWQPLKEQAGLQRLERLFVSRASMNTFLLLVILAVMIYIGSMAFVHLDPMLYGYGVGTIVALVGLTWRMTAWAMRPATRTLARRMRERLWRRVLVKVGVRSPIPEGVGRWYEGRRHPGGNIEAGDRLLRGGAYPTTDKAADPSYKAAVAEGRVSPERMRAESPHVKKAKEPGVKREGSPATGSRLPDSSHFHPANPPDPDGVVTNPGKPGRPGIWVAITATFWNILLNRFIIRRSVWRGVQHMFLMWGILISFAITIPLTFGWMHFEAVNEHTYTVVAMGIPVVTMPVHGILAGLVYHGLTTGAVLTLIGGSMMLLRRLVDKDAKVDQRVNYDLFPLYLIMAVTVTGLALTISHMWAEGWAYPVISIIHQITVVFLLLYLPFGKLFHIPMRALSVAADVYHEVGAHEGLLHCARCQKAYAVASQVRDVVNVLAESGLSLKAPDGETYLAEYCPQCRRVLRALIYSRRELRPEERGSAAPLFAPAGRTLGTEEGAPLGM
ncbi:MAG TPA: MFS transporter [Symbiobacteriaceae bacterium]|nr:MFS transporter [Symbiobacteriaceae bacterium]